MLYPSATELAHGSNRYVLVIATAKQARNIIEEAERSGEQIPDNSVRDAIADISEGKTTWHVNPSVKEEKYT